MKKRKRGSEPQMKGFNIPERIKKLQQEIEKLESVLHLQNYFSKIKNYRGIYVVEMRRYFSVKLEQEGFSVSEIGRIVGKHHSTIIHMLKDNFDDEVASEVKMYVDTWIKEGLYPKSYATSEPSYLHPKGAKTVVKYKLEKL